MRRRVREHDVARWAADFLHTLRGDQDSSSSASVAAAAGGTDLAS